MSRFTALLTICLFLTISCISIEWAATEPNNQTGSVAGTSTSVSALVEPTPINTWSTELTEKEKSLQKKEKDLEAKEAYLNRRFSTSPISIQALYILFSILFVLVLLNFYLDHRRHESHLAQ